VIGSVEAGGESGPFMGLRVGFLKRCDEIFSPVTSRAPWVLAVRRERVSLRGTDFPEVLCLCEYTMAVQ